MTTGRTDLLRQAETYLAVTHEHASRHDVLGANYGCAGCALRQRITAVLAEQPPAVPSVPADADLRDRIAQALAADDGHPWGTLSADTQQHYRDNADAVLAVPPTAADQTDECQQCEDTGACNGGPCPLTDRHERYVKAVLDALARDTSRGPNWDAAADAAIAVADEEIQRDREQRRTDAWQRQVVRDLQGVISRQDREIDDQRKAIARLRADRAAALREAAALLEAHASTLELLSSSDYDNEAFAASHLRTKAAELRRMADEAQQAETEECNGICLHAADIGVPEAGDVVAYAHPDCPQHGEAQQAGEAKPVAYRTPGARSPFCVICARQESDKQPLTAAEVTDDTACNFCGGRVLAIAAESLGAVVNQHFDDEQQAGEGR